ncbi:MAG: hypothetical protein WBG58_06455 [Ignavibacteriaceae bacterium]
MGKIKIQLLISLVIISTFCFGQSVNDYLEVIKKKGDNPINFVQKKLETHDLILFDDGLHSAYEPFQFYIELINAPDTKLDYIFIEVLGINVQSDIDAYLGSETKDKKLLLHVFQDDFSGFGWRYETYLDLLSAIWDYNHSQPDEEKKIKVIGVDQPVYWEGIHNRQDYDVFLRSHIARDYFMYKIIVNQMDYFKSGKKGIYLSNTRHIYKNIRNLEGFPYWNCGTFFYNWHPDKTYAIRIHNVMLSFESVDKEKKSITAEGLDNLTYSWIKLENGIWDKAFELNQNHPVAIPLKDNPFGKAKYVGNYMLNADKNQIMYDAYDALIFLAPLNKLHFSAKMNFFYTDEFKQESKRRIKIIYGENLESFLKDNDATTIDDYIDNLTKYHPRVKNELLNE